jgi:hypothetical protein
VKGSGGSKGAPACERSSSSSPACAACPSAKA